MKSKDIETVINLYLDGQLSAAQKKDMERAMEVDPDARALFEQLRQTDALMKSAAEVFPDDSDSFETSYSQARDSFSTSETGHLFSFLRFASGVAAGLLIALGLFFIYTKSSPTEPPDPPQIAKDDQQKNSTSEKDRYTLSYPKEVTPLVHNVDLYYYKDKEGNEWLIEGIRHEMVKHAAGSSL
jgi:hypothetical protein